MQLVEKHVIKTEHKFFQPNKYTPFGLKKPVQCRKLRDLQNFIYSRGYRNYQ